MENIPKPILNQIKDLGKGLEKYVISSSVIVIYDPNKDEIAGYYSDGINKFVPNYAYFMILDYMGLDGEEEMKYVYNNIIIPNIDLPNNVKLKDNYSKNIRAIQFIESNFRSSLEKGEAKKVDNSNG